MGESAREFKRQPEAWSRRNPWESNAFGYFGHTLALWQVNSSFSEKGLVDAGKVELVLFTSTKVRE